ncbi:MAG: MinD/ParA family protein [Nitrospirae bacterium]|nr:MAG: MinD/ParA family protein [Nitrospirota bacterium]
MERQKIIAIAGPKGGVGKSTISANLAVALAGIGKKVIAVDFDLGGANLNVFFGICEIKHTFDDFVSKKISGLDSAVIKTGIENLRMIHGGDMPNIADLPFNQKADLIVQLFKLDCDMAILDLGAGSSANVVDFLYIAHKTLIVTTPEVTSVLKVYGFVKSALFRWLAVHFKTRQSVGLLSLLEKARDPKNHPELKTMDDFFRNAVQIDPETAESAKKILTTFRPTIIINRVRTTNDVKSGDSIKALMGQYLGILCAEMIIVPEDDTVRRSIASMKPLLLQNPAAPFSLAVKQLALKLLED